MSTLTIRIDGELKQDAARLAKKMGISVSLVIKNSLKEFISTGRLVLEGKDVEVLDVSAPVQKKMDDIAYILDKI